MEAYEEDSIDSIKFCESHGHYLFETPFRQIDMCADNF